MKTRGGFALESHNLKGLGGRIAIGRRWFCKGRFLCSLEGREGGKLRGGDGSSGFLTPMEKGEKSGSSVSRRLGGEAEGGQVKPEGLSCLRV